MYKRGTNMPKLKLPTPNIYMDQLIEEHMKQYQRFFYRLDESLNEELTKIKPLLKSGILTEDGYDLFKERYGKFELNMSVSMFRDLYIHEYGFFLISEDFLKTASEIFYKSKILEVGAGSGFLSACLQGYGIDITPTDAHINDNHYGFKKLHTEVLHTDSIKYLESNKKNFDAVLMSWPDYESDFAYEILKNMESEQTLIYIGENYGGCTANDNFFDTLSECAELMELETQKFNEKSFSWFGIHDQVKVYKIK
jgi:hypothetical protein